MAKYYDTRLTASDISGDPAGISRVDVCASMIASDVYDLLDSIVEELVGKDVFDPIKYDVDFEVE